LLAGCHCITDSDAFMLGNLAPDAIGFVPGIDRNEKKRTHFQTGEQQWGDVTDGDVWTANLERNIGMYAHAVSSDFLLGYYTHILTDITCAKRFWFTFDAQGDEQRKNAYHSDCAELDTILYKKYSDPFSLWASLYAANKHELPELVTRQDITVMLDGIST